jgi:hypothetical protein
LCPFAVLINIIMTWNIAKSEFLNFVVLFLVNFLAIISSLLQLWLYIEDEHTKDEIHKLYLKEYPPSTDELREEFNRLFDR